MSLLELNFYIKAHLGGLRQWQFVGVRQRPPRVRRKRVCSYYQPGALVMAAAVGITSENQQALLTIKSKLRPLRSHYSQSKAN